MENSEADEKMTNLKRKGKEIMVEDDDEGCLNAEAQLGRNYKGKNCLYVSNEDKSDDVKALFFDSASAATNGILNVDDPNSISEVSSDWDQDESNFFDGDYYDDDDGLVYNPENQSYGMDEEYSYLQAQFDKADIPTDMEVDIPWWSDPTQNNGKPFNLSSTSNSSSSQVLFSTGLDQTAHAHDTKLRGGSNLPSGFSCTNGSKSGPWKHGSSPTNHAKGFVDLTPTSTNLKEAATMRLQKFEKFAVIEDYSDHHYATMSSKSKFEKASTKKVQDEWRILQSSLPDTIFVRAYESRMNLLRAVIIGPHGTPYHDGLFFFDLMFPSDYPNRPPKVHYHSGGLRINPNLYACGKVCLSLLGTWPGKSVTENWIPGESTLLQILVSIQALILNANPYYNEPGYSHRGNIYGSKASESYNEQTLINSLKTMIYSMKKPPKNFEEFVPDHFTTRARDILLACRAYTNGARVGSISVVGGSVMRENDKQCSEDFKNRLGFSMNCLIDQFAKLGMSDCDEFRVPEVSNIRKPPKDWTRSPLFEMSQSHVPLHSGGIELSKAKFNASSSLYMSGPLPPVPNAAYPFQELHPTYNYALPYPSSPHFLIKKSSPISPFPVRSPQLVTAHTRVTYYPPPRIAMGLPPTACESQYLVPFPASANSPAWRLHSPGPSTQGVRPNSLSGRNPGNYSSRNATKPDDLNGNVHKWRDS